MNGLLWFVFGGGVIAVPAFWWARVHRAHRDYKAAKAAVPAARAALIAAGKTFLKAAVVCLIAIGVALYAAARKM